MFGSINGNRINSGQFIGYVKNINNIISTMVSLKGKKFDDQVELTKYINHNKRTVFIDKDRIFFNIPSKSLRQITNNNTKCSFIHANGNGFLDNFLLKEHNIVINRKYKESIRTQNIKGFIKNEYV